MRLRVLALDHYFDQDLRALEAHPGLSVRRIPFGRFRTPALSILGDAVATGLATFDRPELGPPRLRYAQWLAEELRRIYLEAPFDIIALPSDTFFYVRALPEAAHRLGVPVVVVQKETTISPDTMQSHSQMVAAHAPFASDFMTVCSERQREFWLRAGADPALIEVTGQPRFDAYAAEGRELPASPRQILFLSYDLDAYDPEAGEGRAGSTWDALRSATESVLLRVARCPETRVVVKLHPQQVRSGEQARLRGLAGTSWGSSFVLADPEMDTRQLMRSVHCVVGFQTTGLYEAAAAGRAVVYAAWGPAYERLKAGLIPYEQAPSSCLRHATGPEGLEVLLGAELRAPDDVACRCWYEEALGPIDGHATDRVVTILRDVSSRWPAGDQRRRLDAARRRFAARLLPRAAATEAFWRAAGMPAAWAGHHAGAQARRKRATELRQLAVSGLRRSPFGKCE